MSAMHYERDAFERDASWAARIMAARTCSAWLSSWDCWARLASAAASRPASPATSACGARRPSARRGQRGRCEGGEHSAADKIRRPNVQGSYFIRGTKQGEGGGGGGRPAGRRRPRRSGAAAAAAWACRCSAPPSRRAGTAAPRAAPGVRRMKLRNSRVVRPPTHFTPDPLTNSVALFLRRQCGAGPTWMSSSTRFRSGIMACSRARSSRSRRAAASASSRLQPVRLLCSRDEMV
jgi:hypothetical protein